MEQRSQSEKERELELYMNAFKEARTLLEYSYNYIKANPSPDQQREVGRQYLLRKLEEHGLGEEFQRPITKIK